MTALAGLQPLNGPCHAVWVTIAGAAAISCCVTSRSRAAMAVLGIPVAVGMHAVTSPHVHLLSGSCQSLCQGPTALHAADTVGSRHAATASPSPPPVRRLPARLPLCPGRADCSASCLPARRLHHAVDQVVLVPPAAIRQMRHQRACHPGRTVVGQIPQLRGETAACVAACCQGMHRWAACKGAAL